MCEPGSVDEPPSRVQLSWTPRKDVNESRNNEAEIAAKKEQVKEEGSPRSFPPMEEDMAIPIRRRPV